MKFGNIFKRPGSPIERHSKNLKGRSGAMAMKARRASLFLFIFYALMLVLALALILLKTGVPGSAWDL